MTDFATSKFLIEKRRYASHQKFKRSDLMDLNVYMEEDSAYKEVLLALETHVWAHNLDAQTQRCVRYVPATWWQHFKQDAIKWGNPFFNPNKIKMKHIVLVTKFQPWLKFPEPPFAIPPKMGSVYIDLDALNEITTEEGL